MFEAEVKIVEVFEKLCLGVENAIKEAQAEFPDVGDPSKLLKENQQCLQDLKGRLYTPDQIKEMGVLHAAVIVNLQDPILKLRQLSFQLKLASYFKKIEERKKPALIPPTNDPSESAPVHASNIRSRLV